MEMKEGTSVEKHLKHMKELMDRLAAIGAPLGSLPKIYAPLITALEAQGDVRHHTKLCAASSGSQEAKDAWSLRMVLEIGTRILMCRGEMQQ